MVKEPKLFRYLRRAKLDSLLLGIANIIRGMFSRDEPIMNISAVRVNGLLPRKGNVTVKAWSLSDLAYLAIRETHDFQTWEPSVHDLVALCNEFTIWDETISRDEFEGLTDEDFDLKFSVGFPQKQFWYQEVYRRIRKEFNRQVELLEVIPSEISSHVDINHACRENTGFDIQTFRKLLLWLYAIGQQHSEFTSVVSSIPRNSSHPELTGSNIQHVIDLFTADYQEYRSSSLEENYFFLKPIVRTSTNRLISVDQYLLARKVADGPFWAIRDYYNNKGSQDFVNEFGHYFEHYVEKLLKHSLRSDMFEPVPDDRRGRLADWFIYTTRFRLIVEQKSAVATLIMKRLYPDLKLIRTYLQKFEKGVHQLDETENRYPDCSRITLKLLLHYETFYVSDGALRPVVVSIASPKLHSTERIFFCDISEFEWLISLLAHQPSYLEAIMDEKLRLEQEPVNRGREFGQLIPRIVREDIKNMSIGFNHWESYLPLGK